MAEVSQKEVMSAQALHEMDVGVFGLKKIRLNNVQRFSGRFGYKVEKIRPQNSHKFAQRYWHFNKLFTQIEMGFIKASLNPFSLVAPSNLNRSTVWISEYPTVAVDTE